MRDYENIEKISAGREPQRAYYIPYDSLEKALRGDKSKSEYYKLLNGKWSFNYYKNEDENAKDLAMTKEMYPAGTLQYQSAVENRLDELEYEGSWIYDEYPDRQRLKAEADAIAGHFMSEQSGGCFIKAVVGMIFNCELCRRRCRYRRYRRFW